MSCPAFISSPRVSRAFERAALMAANHIDRNPVLGLTPAVLAFELPFDQSPVHEPEFVVLQAVADPTFGAELAPVGVTKVQHDELGCAVRPSLGDLPPTPGD